LTKQIKKLQEISGESATLCYQCGLCSGTCPVRSYMDISPTQLVRLYQTGNLERIIKSNTFWICSSCYACQIICPKGIKITKIMEALRQIRLRKEQDSIVVNEISKEEISIFPPIALVANFRKTTA
jgi:heterodisulfide reductase subunit C